METSCNKKKSRDTCIKQCEDFQKLNMNKQIRQYKAYIREVNKAYPSSDKLQIKNRNYVKIAFILFTIHVKQITYVFLQKKKQFINLYEFYRKTSNLKKMAGN